MARSVKPKGDHGVRTEPSGAMYDAQGNGHDESTKRNGTCSSWKATRVLVKRTGVGHQTMTDHLAMQDPKGFQFQIGEMLRKVQPSYEKRIAKADATLQRLRHTIENLSERGPVAAYEAEEELQREYGIRVPFPEAMYGKEVMHEVSFARPVNINVVGSYARQSAIKPTGRFTIDLAVTMPSQIFQENDHMNYRYFYKRAYYLARIAAGIKESEGADFEVEYTLQNDNHLQPIIIVTSNPSVGICEFSQSESEIRILLAADGNLFPMEKTMPDRSCLSSPGVSHSTHDKNTPFYNATLRSELCTIWYLGLLHRATCESKGFRNACVLGSIWLRQRGFGTGLIHGGFGPFEWASLLALLMHRGGAKGGPSLSKNSDCYQMFKATLEYLFAHNLVSTPGFIGQRQSTFIYASQVPMLLDSTSGLNILFKMTPWSYALLQHEVNSTLMLLNMPRGDRFKACFITKVDEPIQRFDWLASFDPSKFCKFETLSSTLDAYDNYTQICFLAHEVLKKGIGNRAHLVSLHGETHLPWVINRIKPKPFPNGKLLIGLLLNAQHMHRTVDRGPSATEKEAAASFRSFWGEKAELRQFNDGSIRESVVWPSSSKHSVLDQLVIYIMQRHLDFETAASLSMPTTQFKWILPFGNSPSPSASHQFMMSAYKMLEKQLGNLKGMPLPTRHVSPVDAQLRYMSPILATEIPTPFVPKEPANVIIQFGGSSRWPNDLVAVQRTKIALLLKIGALLESSATDLSVSTRAGLKDQDNNLSGDAFLDVSYSSGATFRLRIHHEGELSLIERTTENAATQASRELAASALSAYKRDFVQAPLHSQAVNVLSTRFPLLSPSVCLMKFWRDSQLLSHYISDELVELLTIHSFVHPYPWASPGSSITGFIRTLTLISNWDWRLDPLVLDFNGQMEIADHNAIITRFEAWRKVDPAMNRIAMFVASGHDPEGTTWTEYGPPKVVAARLTSLAKAGLDVLNSQEPGLQMASLFKASLADYDFIIHVKNFSSENSSKVTGKMNSFRSLKVHDQNVPSFEAKLLFVEELRKAYSGNILFFYNESGGSVIGGLWNPQTKSRVWKVNVGYSTVPMKRSSEEGDEILLNKAGILHDIANLGKDLVLKIEERSSKIYK